MDSDPTLSLHSWQSRSFTKVESTKISALFHALVSSKLLRCSPNAYAIPLMGKSGVIGVDVPQCSATTLVVITPYGTLLLSLEAGLDVTSVELLTSFITAFTRERPNMENPISADAMSIDAHNAIRLTELEETEKLLYALREIAESSEDAESVRVAFIVLSSTTLGQTYLRENAIKL